MYSKPLNPVYYHFWGLRVPRRKCQKRKVHRFVQISLNYMNLNLPPVQDYRVKPEWLRCLGILLVIQSPILNFSRTLSSGLTTTDRSNSLWRTTRFLYSLSIQVDDVKSSYVPNLNLNPVPRTVRIVSRTVYYPQPPLCHLLFTVRGKRYFDPERKPNSKNSVIHRTKNVTKVYNPLSSPGAPLLKMCVPGCHV